MHVMHRNIAFLSYISTRLHNWTADSIFPRFHQLQSSEDPNIVQAFAKTILSWNYGSDLLLEGQKMGVGLGG